MKRLMMVLLLAMVASVASGQRSNIGYIFPTGGERGSDFIVEIGGQNIITSQKVIISGEGVTGEVLPPSQDDLTAVKKGKRKKITAEDNLQIAQRIKIRVKIAKNAPLGIRDLKLVSKTGAISNHLYFEVSQYPNFIESEPNNSFERANLYGGILPVVVCGQVERGGRDYVTFNAKKGQQLVLEVKARRFVPFLADAVPGWFQPILMLYNEEGREVAFCDDYNLLPDPVIFFKVPKSGKYTLSIKDAIFRGREDFVYRIAVGELPYVTSVYPLGGKRGSTVEVQLEGLNLSKDKMKVKIDKKSEGRIELNGLGKKKVLSNNFYFECSDDKEIVFFEDNGDLRANATPLKVGEVVNGQIDHDRDQDWYFIDVEKGQRLLFSLTARRVGAPTDGKIAIFNKEGKLMGKGDDTLDESEGMITHHADPQMVYGFKDGGRYWLRITDAQNFYGPEYGYRLRFSAVEPDFALRLEPSAISIPQGGTANFTIFIERKFGFKGEIDYMASKLPEGFKVSKARSTAFAKSMKMSITAPLDAPLGKVDVEVVGVNTDPKTKKTITRSANPVVAMLQAFYITHLLPADEFRVDITEMQPFTLELIDGEEDYQLIEGKNVPIRVKINRVSMKDRPIQLMARTPPKGIVIPAITVEPSQDTVTLQAECLEWRWPGAVTRLNLVGTIGATTENRIAGQPRNTINAAVQVVSPILGVKAPTYRDPKLPPIVKKKKPAAVKKNDNKNNQKKVASKKN